MSKLKIKKANRILTIDKHDLEKRLREGYDQIDADGAVIKHATGGRTVSLPEHNKVIEQNDKLIEENKSLKAEIKKFEADLKKSETPKK